MTLRSHASCGSRSTPSTADEAGPRDLVNHQMELRKSITASYDVPTTEIRRKVDNSPNTGGLRIINRLDDSLLPFPGHLTRH